MFVPSQSWQNDHFKYQMALQKDAFSYLTRSPSRWKSNAGPAPVRAQPGSTLQGESSAGTFVGGMTES
jgi:hypothetical protein